MLTGHIGVAFAARALRRDASLPWLLAAALLPDALDALYAVKSICNPFGIYTHSLPAILALALAAMALALARRQSVGAAAAVAVVVAAHLPLDFITGEKMLWLHGPVVGLAIYRWPWLDFVIEVPVVVLGWLLLRRTPGAPRWAVSAAAVLSLVVLQAGMDVAKYFVKAKPRACAASTGWRWPV